MVNGRPKEPTVTLITGGARGIGLETARLFTEKGGRPILFDIDREAGEEAAGTLGLEFYQVDVANADSVEAAIRRVIARHNVINTVVNAAGVNSYGDPTRLSVAEWDRTIDIDLKGAWLTTKFAAPGMKDQGGGTVVNIASIHATMTTSDSFPYAVAKSGLLGLTRSLALNLGPFGIRVNAVSPGYIETRLLTEWFDQGPDPTTARLKVVDLHPLGRIGTPRDVANLVEFLASDRSAFITGANIPVDGGLSVMFAQ